MEILWNICCLFNVVFAHIGRHQVSCLWPLPWRFKAFYSELPVWEEEKNTSTAVPASSRLRRKATTAWSGVWRLSFKYYLLSLSTLRDLTVNFRELTSWKYHVLLSKYKNSRDFPTTFFLGWLCCVMKSMMYGDVPIGSYRVLICYGYSISVWVLSNSK